MSTVGVLTLAGDGLDQDLAGEIRRDALGVLAKIADRVVGGAELVRTDQEARAAVDELAVAAPEVVVVLQCTFTDAGPLLIAAGRLDARFVLWGFPEARTGGALRLNSLSGLQLAAYALSEFGVEYDHVYRRPQDTDATVELARAIEHPRQREDRWSPPPDVDALGDGQLAVAALVRDRVGDAHIGLVGDPPEGFPTCGYDSGLLEAVLGVDVEHVELDDVFSDARGLSEEQRDELARRARTGLQGVEEIDRGAVGATLSIYATLRSMADQRGWNGLAVRCWPEMPTEHRGAACAALAMLGDENMPAACERDVYGNVTQVVLEVLTGGSVTLMDIVELDRHSNTGTLWRCGLAPLSMADPDVAPRAGFHAQSASPLAHDFPLKPGRVTLVRLHQQSDGIALAIAGGEVLTAPPSFSGTSGVCRFDRDAHDVLRAVMDHGLEPHYALVYADVRAPLRALASLWDLPVLEIA